MTSEAKTFLDEVVNDTSDPSRRHSVIKDKRKSNFCQREDMLFLLLCIATEDLSITRDGYLTAATILRVSFFV